MSLISQINTEIMAEVINQLPRLISKIKEVREDLELALDANDLDYLEYSEDLPEELKELHARRSQLNDFENDLEYTLYEIKGVIPSLIELSKL